MTVENSEQIQKPKTDLQEFLHSSLRQTDVKPINREIKHPRYKFYSLSVAISLRSDDQNDDQI